MNAMRLHSTVAALLVLATEVPMADAQGRPADGSGRIPVAKFLYDPPPANSDVVVFKYPGKSGGAIIERITVDGGKVEINGDTIKIEGGKVEIIRRHD